jgi:hypothetical protein
LAPYIGLDLFLSIYLKSVKWTVEKNLEKLALDFVAFSACFPKSFFFEILPRRRKRHFVLKVFLLSKKVAPLKMKVNYSLATLCLICLLYHSTEGRTTHLPGEKLSVVLHIIMTDTVMIFIFSHFHQFRRRNGRFSWKSMIL